MMENIRMSTWYFNGYARPAGAIGERERFTAEIKAPFLSVALEKLYQQYEHVSITGCSSYPDDPDMEGA